jgi:hypothetical protein
MLEILILGYILTSNSTQVKVIYPSKKEVGNQVYDKDHNLVSFNTGDWTYDGFPDNGVKIAPVTDFPEYENVLAIHNDFMTEYQELTWVGHGDWVDWETDYPNWPPLIIPPYPTSHSDNYTDDAVIYSRADDLGLWTYYGYSEIPDGKFLIELEKDTPPSWFSPYGSFTLFNIPMKGEDRKFNFPYAIYVPDSEWNISNSGSWELEGVLALSPIDGKLYPILEKRSAFFSEVSPNRPWGVDIKAPEQGEHKVHSDPYTDSEFKVVLYTDRGVFTKKVAFKGTFIWGGLAGWTDRFSITVGPVPRIEDAIKIIDKDNAMEPTL